MSSYQKEITKRAKSVDEAVEEALAELGVSRDEVEITIVEEGSKGFLGLGAKEAEVTVGVRDGQTFCAKKFLTDIFEAMNLPVEIEAKHEDDTMEINLSGDHMGIVIGKRGDTLDSLQYLTSLVVNRGAQDYTKVSIDTENYREKREEALVALSKRLEEKVGKSGKKYTLEPMNPYERRIIHANLQNSGSVTTYSIGEEPYRKVVIAPKNEKPAYKKNHQKKNSDRRPVERKPAEQKQAAAHVQIPPRRPKVDYKMPYNKHKASSFEEYLAGSSHEEEES